MEASSFVGDVLLVLLFTCLSSAPAEIAREDAETAMVAVVLGMMLLQYEKDIDRS